jgi:membrane-associated phospholipid phosphatase
LRWFVTVLLLAGFLVLALLSRKTGALSGWDQRALDWMVAWRSPARSRALWLFTLTGDNALLAPLSATLVLLLWAWGRRSLATVAVNGLIVSWPLMEIAKAAVGRSRPPQALALIQQPGSDSMPSGHAVMSVVFLGLLLYALFRWAGRGESRYAARAGAVLKWLGLAAGVIVAAAIGVSRVYLGAHWPSDVLAGWCLGGALLLSALGGARRWEETGGPRDLARDTSPWAPRNRWSLAAYLLCVVCGMAVVAGLLDPLS